MAFLYTKTVEGKKYYYLRESKRNGKKVSVRDVAYLGNSFSKAKTAFDEVLSKYPSATAKNSPQITLKWHKLLSRQDVDITSISLIDAYYYSTILNETGDGGEAFFTIFKNKTITHYTDYNQTQLGRAVCLKYFNSPKQIIAYYKRGLALRKESVSSNKRFSKILSKSPTLKNLKLAFKEFKESFEEICGIYSIISWIGIETWQQEFEELLDRLIKKNDLEPVRGQILSTVYAPWKSTALLEIQEKLEKGVSPEKIANEYQFLRSWVVVWYKPLTKEWVESLRTKQTHAPPKQFLFKKIVSMLKPTKEESKMLAIAPYIVFFKDWRDDTRRFHAFNWSFLFDELGKHFKVARDDIGLFTLDELWSALEKNSIDLQLINKRKEGCVVTINTENRKIMVIDGAVPEKYSKIESVINAQPKELVVRGRTAHPGVVSGIVKVIRSYHDIKRVQSGDILVANTTHPNYLPAMQKAAAFVTNEGGIISHAAIVARELRKPCITGTKNATTLLLDGDLVEVDATNGTVKVVKR